MTTPKRGSAVAAAFVAIGAVLFAAPAASASQGSVPEEVATYATDAEGLVMRLGDLFGDIEFDDTTTVGQLNRVFVFTEAFLADGRADVAVERANVWTAPITIADEPVGLATIWINPATVEPELADFVQDADSAVAMADVPADAYLVHDEPRGAWFTLVEDTLTPLVAGSTGLTGDITLSAYQRALAGAAAEAATAVEPAETGTILPVAIISAAALAVILVLLIPMIRGRRSGTGDAAAIAAPVVAVTLPEVTKPAKTD